MSQCDPCAPATNCPTEDDFTYSITSGPGYAVVPPPVDPPCAGCGAPLDCLGQGAGDTDYKYSLTGDPTFPFFFLCPAGYSCNPPDGDQPFYIACCGHLITRYRNSKTTLAQLNALYQSMLGECNGYVSECAPSDLPPVPPSPGPGPTVNPTTVYWNSPQGCSCTATIFGTPYIFGYLVGAGTFTAPSLKQANAYAAAFACQKVQGQCRDKTAYLSNIPTTGTVCTAYGPVDIHVFGFSGNVAFTVSGLPAGFTYTTSSDVNGNTYLTISGTPTRSGSFTFTVTATSGLYSTKRDYALTIAPLLSGCPVTIQDLGAWTPNGPASVGPGSTYGGSVSGAQGNIWAQGNFYSGCTLGGVSQWQFTGSLCRCSSTGAYDASVILTWTYTQDTCGANDSWGSIEVFWKGIGVSENALMSHITSGGSQVVSLPGVGTGPQNITVRVGVNGGTPSASKGMLDVQVSLTPLVPP